MEDFQDFREAVRTEGARTPAPPLGAILERRRSAMPGWQLVAALAVLMALGAVPLYEKKRQADQDRADMLLMKQVKDALSQSVPQAFSPLMYGERKP